MIRKLTAAIRRFFSRLFGRKSPAVADVGIPISPPRVEYPPCALRIRQMLDLPEVRPRRGFTPGVWQTGTDNFVGAYRMLLRLCPPSCIKIARKAGRIRFVAVLPDGTGSILLTDKVGNRRDAIAVMTFSVADIPELKELRFSIKNKAKKA